MFNLDLPYVFSTSVCLTHIYFTSHLVSVILVFHMPSVHMVPAAGILFLTYR